ncbi:MAG: hypothetical protein J6Q74_01560 [Clostridia bacterium]|nr:hypothetical protein [Clostridia bacterium]
MDNSIFDKYIQELKEMQKKAMPVLAQQVKTVQPPIEQNSETMTGGGGLIVITTAGRGLYPIANAKVTVFLGSADSMTVVAESLTDQSGRTPIMNLSAPSSEFAEAPNPSERPYAYYNIRTVADGYTETQNYNVAVFDDITSIQNVSLYPVASRPDGNKPIIINELDNYQL